MSASVAHSEYEMSSCVSRQRSSFSEIQPFCSIISGAHSFFQTCKALSISDGSIVMCISRIMDIAPLQLTPVHRWPSRQATAFDYFGTQSPVAVAPGLHLGPSGAPVEHISAARTSPSLQLTDSGPVTVLI